MAKVIEQIVRIVTDGEETRAEVVGEMVRCNDCKHRNGSACDYSAVWLRENGFCQWGERSEE